MNDQAENQEKHAELLKQATAMNEALLNHAASAYAYNKINNVLLMQILAQLEGRDLEQIRANVDRYLAEFADEYRKMNAQV